MTAIDHIVIIGLLVFIGILAVLAMIVEEQQEAHAPGGGAENNEGEEKFQHNEKEAAHGRLS